MRAILLIVAFAVSNFAVAQVQEKILDEGTSSYAPTRTSLYMARSADYEEGDEWEFGHDLQGEFFNLEVRGIYEGLQVNEKNELLGVKGGTAKVIGQVEAEGHSAGGDFAFPVIERKITLNSDVKVRFQLIQRGTARIWVALFE